MKRMKQIALFGAVFATSLLVAACAISNGGPADNELGYVKCSSDTDCAEAGGVCLDREPFDYCGTECTIIDDCKYLEPETGFVMDCVFWRCVPTDEAIDPIEDGDEPDGDEPDGDTDGDTDTETETEVETDGDVVDGDTTEQDVVDGDTTEQDVVDGDATEQDVVTDGDLETEAELDVEEEVEVEAEVEVEVETELEAEIEAETETEV
jgi:hypothetical protein